MSRERERRADPGLTSQPPLVLRCFPGVPRRPLEIEASETFILPRGKPRNKLPWRARRSGEKALRAFSRDRDSWIPFFSPLPARKNTRHTVDASSPRVIPRRLGSHRILFSLLADKGTGARLIRSILLRGRLELPGR